MGGLSVRTDSGEPKCFRRLANGHDQKRSRLPAVGRSCPCSGTALVVPEVQFDKVVAKLPADAVDARRAASAFVDSGVLTRFQADRLLGGRSDGFHLGPYVILEPISKGPTGRVYKARHRTMNRFVAVKVLDPAKTINAADRDAVQAEAKAAARLAHTNVVTVLDINEVNDRLYFVLEFVDGSTAEATVKRGGPLPLDRACEVGRQTALGLAHAHDKGLTHGAVNPTNVMMGRASGRTDLPQAKLLNTGQARLRTLSGPVPEMAVYRGPTEDTSPAGDLHGLGATLYFLLTGRAPVPYHKRGVISDPLPVEHVRPDAPPQVVELVRRLMSANPTMSTLGRGIRGHARSVRRTGRQRGSRFQRHTGALTNVGSFNSLLSGLVAPVVRVQGRNAVDRTRGARDGSHVGRRRAGYALANAEPAPEARTAASDRSYPGENRQTQNHCSIDDRSGIKIPSCLQIARQVPFQFRVSRNGTPPARFCLLPNVVFLVMTGCGGIRSIPNASRKLDDSWVGVVIFRSRAHTSGLIPRRFGVPGHVGIRFGVDRT